MLLRYWLTSALASDLRPRPNLPIHPKEQEVTQLQREDNDSDKRTSHLM